MRAKKTLYIVCYDISDDKRRRKIGKLLEAVGIRVNFSVFECLLTDIQMKKVREKIEKTIHSREDMVIFYTMCVNCYTKIVYIPKTKEPYHCVTIV